MKKELTFNFTNESVGVIVKDNDPLFRLSDIGKVLELTNVYRQAKAFKKGVHTVTTLTKGGEQDVVYVSESNLYRLIFKSRKKEAIRFQDWVVEEVIPSIRKTGKYFIPDKLKKDSTENRKLLTSEWKKHGISKPKEYKDLTLKEYDSLGFEDGKRKKDLTEKELLTLNALESVEMLKLFSDDKINGFLECSDSIKETSNSINQLTNKKEEG